MNRKLAWIGSLALIMNFGVVWADDDDDDDAETTIRLMDAAEAELPSAVTEDIVLPLPEDHPGAQNGQQGIDIANENRRRGDDGLSNAEDALEQVNDLVEDALENREIPGRSDELPDVPGVPDLPEIPDNPAG